MKYTVLLHAITLACTSASRDERESRPSNALIEEQQEQELGQGALRARPGGSSLEAWEIEEGAEEAMDEDYADEFADDGEEEGYDENEAEEWEDEDYEDYEDYEVDYDEDGYGYTAAEAIVDFQDLEDELTSVIERHLFQGTAKREMEVVDEGEDEEEEYYDGDEDEDVEDYEDIILSTTNSQPNTQSIMALKGQQNTLEGGVAASRNMRHKKRGNKRGRNKRGRNKRNNKKRGKRNKRGNKKRGKRNKRNNAKTGGRGSFAGGNVCLSKPDPYRTCLQRTVDPYSGVNHDSIQRGRYNTGAKMYQKGHRDFGAGRKNSDYLDPYVNNKNAPLEPYTKPYTASGERLISGTMHLSLLQDSTKINCNTMLQIEEVTLNYLADNIGSDSSFMPVCVFTSDSAHVKQKVPDKNMKFAESNTLQLEITYISKIGGTRNGMTRNLSGDEEDMDLGVDIDRDLRRKNNRRCTAIDKALCCSQNAIQNNVGAYCDKTSCDVRNCGPGRLPNQRRLGGEESTSLMQTKEDEVERNLHRTGHNIPPYVLDGKDYNNSVRKFTVFLPSESRSILDAPDIESVATCSANRYSIDTYDSPSIMCEDFEDANCEENEDIVPAPDVEEDCISSEPTSMPTFVEGIEADTEIPTTNPTVYPTGSPTMYPTVSPTMYPTTSPTMYPTVSPTVSPTETPTLSPTVSCTKDELNECCARGDASKCEKLGCRIKDCLRL